MARPGRKPGFLIDVAIAWHLVRRELLTLAEAAALLGCSTPTVSRAVNGEARRRGLPLTCQADGRAEVIATRAARLAAARRARAAARRVAPGRTA